MSNKLFPVNSFIVDQGLTNLGQFIGLNLGPGLRATDQGKYLGLDVNPNGIAWPVSDAVFSVSAAADPTATLRADLSLQAPGTSTTLSCTGTVARNLLLPNLSGRLVIAQSPTGIVVIGQDAEDQGSNAGIQYVTPVANGAALRTSQYGANTGVPGVVGFKSRGLPVGTLLSVAVGDVLWRATAIGVTGNDLLIPLAGTIGFEVPATGLFPTSVSPDFIVALAKDTTNSRRTVWTMVGMTGDLNMALAGSRVRLKEGANAMQGVATLGAGGTVLVPNTLVTATTRFIVTIQDGAAPLGTIYVSARVAGASFTISSNNAADTCTVAWQLWEPAP